MVLEFEIIYINIHHNRGLFVFARHLGENHEFDVPEGSMLKDLPVYHYKEIQPRDENDKPLKDVFVFRPLNVERLFDKSFKEGDIVSLTLTFPTSLSLALCNSQDSSFGECFSLRRVHASFTKIAIAFGETRRERQEYGLLIVN